MRTGKVSETVLKRAVLSRIKNKNSFLLSGAGLGNDGAVLRMGEAAAVAGAVVAEQISHQAYYGINRAVNNLAVRNAESLGVVLNIIIGKEVQENELRAFMEEAQETCDALGMEIVGGHTEVSEAVQGFIPTFTALGRCFGDASEPKFEPDKCHPSIILTKHVGLEGASIAALEKEGELSSYFNRDIAENAKLFKNDISVIKEARIAFETAPVLLHDVSKGGILSALWDITEKTGMGMEVDIRSIPIRQETVEICEFFSVNPYELISGGVLLIITEKEEEVCAALAGEGIPAAVIGRLTGGNDRILSYNEVKSFLNRPSEDGIYKILSNGR